MVDWIELWAVPRPLQLRCLLFVQEFSGWMRRNAILNEDHAAVYVYVQFRLFYEQFHVLGSNHSDVRWTEIQTSSATARHGNPNHLARRVFHCSYNILLVNTLSQWQPNVHVARYKLLHGAFVSKQHFPSLSACPVAMTSFSTSLVSGVALLSCLWDFSPTSLLRRLEIVLERIAVPFKRKIARMFLFELFGEHITICLTERSSMGLFFRGRPDLFLS